MISGKNCLSKSSVGKKVIMAVTGLLLLGFVMGHMAGNLLIFLGPDVLNDYAKHLADLGPLLWVVRIVLLLTVLAHVVMAIKLTRENQEARPVAYHSKDTGQTTFGGRTMMLTGLVLVSFIVFHLLHFTFKVTHPEISHGVDHLGRHDVYSMVVMSFKDVQLVVAYVLAMTALCFHLSHGIASALQTLGVSNENNHNCFRRAGQGLAALIFLGYISIPTSIYFGIIKV